MTVKMLSLNVRLLSRDIKLHSCNECSKINVTQIDTFAINETIVIPVVSEYKINNRSEIRPISAAFERLKQQIGN